MGVILANRLKNHINSSLQDLLFLEDHPNDEAKKYSRGIVAICLAGLSGKDYPSIVKYVVDGAKDNGIDGAYYDQAKNKLYIVQGKWSSKGTSTIDTGDMHKFISGVYDLLNEEWDKFNDRMKDISTEISDGIRRDPEVIVVATFNSDNKVSDDCMGIINKFLSDNNSESQEVVSFRPFDLNKIIRTMKSVKSGSKSDVEVNLLQWGEQKEPYYAIYGKISCADVAEWHADHGDALFSENIRSTLTDSDINNQIEQALLKKPKEFWYLNNGITAIAEEIKRKTIGLGEQKDSSNWNVSNIKIVNGAQTTGSIVNAYQKNKEAVQNAYVQIKIISLESAPLDIANKITTATNTQNRVEAKDFLALDTTQDGLAESFRSLGIHYCYRRGEKFTSEDSGLDVQDLAMSLAISGDSMANVVVAKRNAGSLTDPNGHYNKIFHSAIDANAAWDMVRKWRTASKSVSSLAGTLSGREAQLAIHGNRFIEHMLVRHSKATPSVETAKNIHGNLKKIVDEEYGDCYLAVLFKNAKKCDRLKNILLENL